MLPHRIGHDGGFRDCRRVVRREASQQLAIGIASGFAGDRVAARTVDVTVGVPAEDPCRPEAVLRERARELTLKIRAGYVDSDDLAAARVTVDHGALLFRCSVLPPTPAGSLRRGTRVRHTLGAIGTALVLAASAAAHPGPWCWTLTKTMRRIDGARIHVGSRRIRVDRDTTLCSAEGRRIRRRGNVYSKHFLCTYTTNGGLGRDVQFRVHVLGRTRFVITDGQWIA
jgi:hypothetical protein